MSEASDYGKGDRSRSKPGEELDMGKFGCKNRGLHVYRGEKECVYCGKKSEG